MKKILSNLTISYLSSFLGFLILMLSARMLGAEQFAWVAIGIAVGGFAMPLINLGSERTFVRDALAIDDALAVEQMIIKSFGMCVTITLIITLIIGIGSFVYANDVIDAIAIGTFSLWAALQGLYPSAWFDFLLETKKQNLIVLGERVTGLVFIAGGAVLLHHYFQIRAVAGLPAILGSILLAIRIVSITTQVKTWWYKFGKTRFKWHLSFPRRNVGGINFRVTMAVFFNALLTYGNQLVLGAGGNKTELAAYGLAFQIISLIFLFQAIALRLVNRKIANVCILRQGILYSVITNGLFLGGGSAVLAGGAFIITKYLPLILADNRFEIMSQFIPLLCIWAVVVGFGQCISQHLLTLKQESFYLVITIFGGITALCLGLLYVPLYGGLAVALILLSVHGFSIMMSFLRLMYVIYK
jgi:O-antigen/teichoic acid export membrane protein